MYTANLYLAFQRKDGKEGLRLVSSSKFQTSSLNAAKAHATHICRSNDVLSAWRSQDPTTRWSPVIEEGDEKYVRKVFRTPPPEVEKNLLSAYVELIW